MKIKFFTVAFKSQGWIQNAYKCFFETFPEENLLVINNNPAKDTLGPCGYDIDARHKTWESKCDEETEWLEEQENITILYPLDNTDVQSHGKGIDRARDWCLENGYDYFCMFEPDCEWHDTNWFESLKNGILKNDNWVAGIASLNSGNLMCAISLWKLEPTKDISFEILPKEEDRQHPLYKEKIKEGKVGTNPQQIEFFNSHWDTCLKAWFHCLKNEKVAMVDAPGMHHYWNGTIKDYKSEKYGGLKPRFSQARKEVCCTIVSPNHLPHGIAALRQFQKHNDSDLVMLVTDQHDLSLCIEKFRDIQFINTTNLTDADISLAKYHGDALRWALKPCLLLQLLHDYDKSIYIDCDIHCHNTFQAMNDAMDDFGVVLTPHWRSIDPHNEQFEFIMSDGYFNAGIMGVTPKGKPALKWWKAACEWKCDKKYKGLFVDQRYLDIMAIHYPDCCHMLSHRGYNVAPWNSNNNLSEKEEIIKIKKKWPLVAIHFRPEHNDPLLETLYRDYINNIEKTKDILHQFKIEFKPIKKEWGIFKNDDGPLSNKLWDEKTANKMITIFRKGLVKGYPAGKDYQIQNIKDAFVKI